MTPRPFRYRCALAAAGLLLAAATLAVGGAARAQGLSLGSKGDRPIEIYADSGIEWDQNGQRYVARGNGKAIQGNTTVYGDTLIAYYKDVPKKGSEIYRMDAIGHVRIISRTDTAYGDHAVYDVNRDIVVLTGKNLRYITPQDVITARDTLEYYETKQMAVARGNALARPLDKKDQRSVRADVLTILFSRDGKTQKPAGKTQHATGKTQKPAGKNADDHQIERMDAYGHVIVTRPGEIARGARGVYFPDKDIANLWGSVRITRGDNQFNGDRAEVNFKTGISRLMNEGKGPPVKALIVPQTKQQGGKKTGPARNKDKTGGQSR